MTRRAWWWVGGTVGAAVLGLVGWRIYNAGQEGQEVMPTTFQDTPTLTATCYRHGVPQQGVTLYRVAPGKFLRAEAANAFLRMAAAAAADGVQLHVNSAFRDNAQQVALYARFKATGSPQTAPPGFSNHQDGTATDLESGGGTNAAFRWLTANAARFGFARTVASEPWHWEYVASGGQGVA